MCVFGGYDSKRYLNDFHRYHFESSTWSPMTVSSGSAPCTLCGHVGAVDTDKMSPSPRGGHTAVVHEDRMYVFGGCDGWNYFNDCYVFDFERYLWTAVRISGTAPGARSAPATVVHPGRNAMYVFGGYDGARSLNDLFCLDLGTHEWEHMQTNGTPPSPRGGHTAVVFGDSMYAFGGKSGRSPFNDLCGFNFETRLWSPMPMDPSAPAARCAHVCVVQGRSLFVFGGYDGRRYFDDCFEFRFEAPAATAVLSLSCDLELMVNNDQFADIRFAVDGRIVHAHKTILFARSEYFRRMLTGGYRESADDTIEIQGVSHSVFVAVLTFLYTGKTPRRLSPQLAMDLLEVSNLYGIEPLKKICADQVARNLQVDNVASVLEAADSYGAAALRGACVDFIVLHLAEVVRTDAFKDLVRTETRDLVLCVLMSATSRSRHAVAGAGAGVASAAAGDAQAYAAASTPPSVQRAAGRGAASSLPAERARFE